MSAASRSARVSALAKINLGLQVLGRRPDGFHELRTIFQTISLGDTLECEFTPSHRTAITVASNVPIPGENLVERAASMVLAAARKPGQVRIGLSKAIPMGAGLGGGSSDAAAVLLALPALAGAALPLERLLEVAAELGSDVPFFLLGGTAVALGRGTELYPLQDLPARRALVIAPGVHVSTAQAYRELGRPELTSSSGGNRINSFESLVWQLSTGSPAGLAATHNDFEAVVFGRHPQLRTIKRKLARLGARPALMSGSGSSVYGIFRTRVEAAAARRAVPEALAVTLVSRARYQGMWWRRLGAHITGKVWPPRSRYA
jgi:4-diphosphocytidyl-2-C-methyl-D-erythritol kinase